MPQSLLELQFQMRESGGGGVRTGCGGEGARGGGGQGEA